LGIGTNKFGKSWAHRGGKSTCQIDAITDDFGDESRCTYDDFVNDIDGE